jgi:hypothetical protein
VFVNAEGEGFKKKDMLSPLCNRPWRLRFARCQGTSIFRTDGSQIAVANLTRQLPFTPGKLPAAHFLEAESMLSASINYATACPHKCGSINKIGIEYINSK